MDLAERPITPSGANRLNERDGDLGGLAAMPKRIDGVIFLAVDINVRCWVALTPRPRAEITGESGSE